MRLRVAKARSDGRPTRPTLSTGWVLVEVAVRPSRAAARSAQRASGSSRPTLRRSRPAGTRSPSQRARLSITLVTPPSDVAFTITRVAVSTRRAVVAVGDVEREEAAEPGPAHRLDRRDALRRRSASTAADAVWRCTRTSSVFRPRSSSQAGSGAATMPVTVRKRAQRGRPSPRPCTTTAPSRASSWPARYFVALCSDEVGAVLERAQVHGRRGGRVDDDRRGVRGGGLEVGHRQERVRRRLEPDELHVRRRRRRSGRTRRSEGPSARAS